jgi:hypothetical protein
MRCWLQQSAYRPPARGFWRCRNRSAVLLRCRAVSPLTENQRVQRIKDLVTDLHSDPPEKRETLRLQWGQSEQLLEVIRIGVDEVVLNPESHRIRSQLQDDPAWAEASSDPFSDGAQRIIERHVREARDAEDLAALRQSLIREGQTDPGVVTHKGLLINANTRAVVLREAEDPAHRFIRAAVLPASVSAQELTLLELRLQMQRDLKVDYSFTNELLFVEELFSRRGLSAAQIAVELRKTEAEIKNSLKYLDLIRVMQKAPAKPLPLTFFNTLKAEQLREVHRVYTGLLDRDRAGASEYLRGFVLSVAVGVKSVHQIRHLDAHFMQEYMLSHLEEDEVVGSVAEKLVSPKPSDSPQPPEGVSKLLGPSDEHSPDPPQVDVSRLLDVVTSRDKRVVVPDSNLHLDRDDLKDALQAAVAAGIKEKRQELKDEDQLGAPANAVKEATSRLAKARETFLAVHDNPEFDDKRQKTLEAAFKKLNRSSRDLANVLGKAGVIEK